MHLNGFDIVIITILTLSTLLGMARGLILELLCLLPWALAFFFACFFYLSVGDHYFLVIDSGRFRSFIAFAFIFIIVFMAGSLVSHCLKSTHKDSGLSRSGTNKVLGMIYGFLRGLLIVLLIIAFAEQTGLNKAPWYKQSRLVPLGGFANIAEPQITNVINNNSTTNNIINVSECIIA